MEQHITKYTEFYSRNGSFSGGNELLIPSLITGLGAFGIIELNNFIKSCINFLKIIDKNFFDLVDSGTKTFDEICNIALKTLNNGNYSKINNNQLGSFYGAFDKALQVSSSPFYGGVDCDCGANVMSYWTNSTYLVFKGGNDVEKDVALLISGVNILTRQVEKSIKSKPNTKDAVKKYLSALNKLKEDINNIRSELLKKNSSMKKDFASYSKFTPEKISKTLADKVKNSKSRAEFIESMKMLAPTAFHANSLKKTISKLNSAIKNFEKADVNNKFANIMNKLILNLTEPGLDHVKKIHVSKITKFEASAEEIVHNENINSSAHYDFLGSGGESIFGGELLELDKKVDLMNKYNDTLQPYLETSFRRDNEKMITEMVKTAGDASEEIYANKLILDNTDIINFLSNLDLLKVIDLEQEEVRNAFFRNDKMFGIGNSADSYMTNLETVIRLGKDVETKIGPRFTTFIKSLENYKQFLLDSSKKLSDIVNNRGFNAKFFGGLYAKWSYTMSDVIKVFTRGIIISQMRIGLEHSIKELENYNKDQSDMNAKIMGREINLTVKICNNILENLSDHANFPIPKELAKVIIQENLDGFVQIQRASQALNEKCKTYQMHLVKNPTKAREISDLLKKVAIDINSIGDESFKHLTDFLEYFHVESVAVNGNKYADEDAFSISQDVDANLTNLVVANHKKNHNLSLYDNDYLGKKYNEPTCFPIKLGDTLASHVPTMICVTSDKSVVKKSSINNSINTYGGKRVFPAKISNGFQNTRNSFVIPTDKTLPYSLGAGNDITALAANLGDNDYSITGSITAPSYLPRKISFLAKEEIISRYNLATEHLDKGVRQITSLKNLFSVFQSIDQAYKSETTDNDKTMKIGEIYECFINYIVKTTRYPILYKVNIYDTEKYVCSHIGLRKFGYDVIMPFEVGSNASFRTSKNDMFSVLEKLSLREYFDGADYGNLVSKDKWSNEPFPKTTEIIDYQNENSDKTDKSYFSNNLTLSSMFTQCDNLCIMSIKSIICKIFSVLALFNVINLDDLHKNLPFNQLRAIYGGIETTTMTPSVNADNCELYVRLYLLMSFYKGLFFEEVIGSGQNHIIAGAKRMAVLPSGNTVFDELLKFIFLRNFDIKLFSTNSSTNTIDELSFGIFVDICNKIAAKYGSTFQKIQKITLDLVDEINRRYGIVSTDQIKKLMQDEKQSKFPGIKKISIIEGKEVDEITANPPILLDGENGNFRNTKVDSDKVQFGKTTVGRVLTIINPTADEFNMSEILSVVYNFRRKLDSMTSAMTTELNRRSNANASDLYKHNNISNKCKIIKRQISEYSDNRHKLDYLRDSMSKLGEIIINNVNNDEVRYKELVLTPCSLLNKIYNRLIATSNLYGKQKYNNILNLNTHLYDLYSINTNLVGINKTSNMPKLDFSVLAKTCGEFLEQIIAYHRKFIPNLVNTGGILTKTINMLINQHNYVWHNKGPLSDDSLDYKSIVYVPLNDYSEFPNVLYNDGTEEMIGTNSWTAYRGKDIYDDPIMISDPRNRTVNSAKPGSSTFPKLKMELLSQRFSPKNVYQLFEYVLITAYRIFFEQVGIMYRPLFADFVSKLSSAIDFQNIVRNDTTQELGGVHKFQKNLPFSNKIAAVYKSIYDNYEKGTVLLQDKLSSMPPDSLVIMKNYLGLFMFLLKHIITQAHVHGQILAINRYSGGEGLDQQDQQNYTKGVAGSNELFPLPGNGAQDYVDYYTKLTRDRGGVGMKIYSGVEPSLSDFSSLDKLKKLAEDTIALDSTMFASLTDVYNNINYDELSFGADLDANISKVFLNKFSYKVPPKKLLTAADTINHKQNDLSQLKIAKNNEDFTRELMKYYNKGIKQDFFDYNNVDSTIRGTLIEKTISNTLNNKYFTGISSFCRKYLEDLKNSPGMMYDARVEGGRTPDEILENFLSGASPTVGLVERQGYINPPITYNLTPEMIFPARNLFSNSYLQAKNVNDIVTISEDLLTKTGSVNVDVINMVVNTLGVSRKVTLNNRANQPNYNLPKDVYVYADKECTRPAIGVDGINGKKVYIKIPTTEIPDLYSFNVNNQRNSDGVTSAFTNYELFSGMCMGQRNKQLNDNSVKKIVRFIDNICTSSSTCGLDNNIVPEENVGLINDALSMYIKYVNLSQANAKSFEDYLPHFIKERMDLLMGKDYEAFIDIYGAINPTFYASYNRRMLGVNSKNEIIMTQRPSNFEDKEELSALGGLFSFPAETISKFGVAVAGDYYIKHDDTKDAPHLLKYEDINERPGSFIMCINGIQRQEDIYDNFEYTDCNPYYDLLLCAIPTKSFSYESKKGIPVNNYSRLSSPGDRLKFSGLDQKIISRNSNNYIDYVTALESIVTESSDKSHTKSMGNLTRKQSCGYDIIIQDNEYNKPKFLSNVYYYIFRHIVAGDDSPQFETRYNKFKKIMTDYFLKAYTKYNSLDDFREYKGTNNTCSYMPLLTQIDFKKVIGNTQVINSLDAYLKNKSIEKYKLLNELISSIPHNNMLSLGLKLDSSQLNENYSIFKVGNYSTPKYNKYYSKLAETTKQDIEVLFNEEIEIFRFNPDLTLVANGLFIRSCLVDINSDTAIKNRYLTVLACLGKNSIKYIIEASKTINLSTGGAPVDYDIHKHLRIALSLNTQQFLDAFRAFIKIVLFCNFLATLKLSIALSTKDVKIFNDPNLYSAGIVTDSLREAFTYYNNISGIPPDSVLDRIELPGLYMGETQNLVYKKSEGANAFNYSEISLASDNDYHIKLGNSINSTIFAEPQSKVGIPNTTLYGDDILELPFNPSKGGIGSWIGFGSSKTPPNQYLFNSINSTDIIPSIIAAYTKCGLQGLFGNRDTLPDEIPVEIVSSTSDDYTGSAKRGVSQSDNKQIFTILNKIGHSNVVNSKKFKNEAELPIQLAINIQTFSYQDGKQGKVSDINKVYNPTSTTLRAFMGFVMMCIFNSGDYSQTKFFKDDIVLNGSDNSEGNKVNSIISGCRLMYLKRTKQYLKVINYENKPEDSDYMEIYHNNNTDVLETQVNEKLDMINEIHNMKFIRNLFNDAYSYGYSSSSLGYFIAEASKNKIFNNLSEMLSFFNTVCGRQFINKFITFAGMNTIFRDSTIGPILKIFPAFDLTQIVLLQPSNKISSIAGLKSEKIIIPAVPEVPAMKKRRKYSRYTEKSPSNNYKVNNMTEDQFKSNYKAYNKQISRLLIGLQSTYSRNKELFNKLYKIKVNLPAIKLYVDQELSVGSIKLNKITTTQQDVPQLPEPEKVGRGSPDAILQFKQYRFPTFIDENYTEKNCIMSELALPEVSLEDMVLRSKNAISFGLSLYKSFKSVYSEIGDSPKYLESNADLDDMMSTKKYQKKNPITYAVELIPNIINCISKNSVGSFTEVNILKTANVNKIKSFKSLGIKCRNIYELDKLFIGDKAELLNIIKPFLTQDNIMTLSIENFEWTKKLIGESDKNYISTMSKLIKYLYEIEFKSMFGNMFPIFNNLDNPKFNISVDPTQNNPLLDNVDRQPLICYRHNILFGSLQTSLPGLFSYQNLQQELVDIMDYKDFVELAFGRDIKSPNAISLKSVGFTEPNMVSAQELISLLEIDPNSAKLNEIMSLEKNTSLLNRNGVNNNVDQLIMENILDIGIFPLNIHAMAKEIPMAEMINNVYGYDIIMKWLLDYNPNLDMIKSSYFRPQTGRPDEPPADLSLYSRSKISEKVSDQSSSDTTVVENSDEVQLVKNKLFNSSVYNYCVNPSKSYVYPVGLSESQINPHTWLTIHPSMSNSSKLNGINKSKLDNCVGINPNMLGGGGAPNGIYTTKVNAQTYTVNDTIDNLSHNVTSILTEDYMNVKNDIVGSPIHPNSGKHLLVGILQNEARNGLFPIQYNFTHIAKPDIACRADATLCAQTLNVSLGIHLSKVNGKINNTNIKKSKLVKSLLGKNSYPYISSNNSITVRPDRNKTPLNINFAGGPHSVLNHIEVDYKDTSYYAKQRVGNMKTYAMDLMHGVDYECQQPVLGINIFADILMNIYTAKLYDEIRSQSKKSSRVLTGESAIYDQYHD